MLINTIKAGLIFLLFTLSSSCFGQFYVGPKVGFGLNNISAKPEFGGLNSKAKFQPLFGVVVEKPIIGGFSVQLEAQLASKGAKFEASQRSATSFEGLTGFTDLNDNGMQDDGEEFEIPVLYSNYDVKINYIEIPLLFKYELFAGSIGYFFNVGPVLGLGLKATATPELVDGDGNTESPGLLPVNNGLSTTNYTEFFSNTQGGEILVQEEDLFEGNNFRTLKKSDFGLAFGGGFAFDIGIGRLYTDLRYVAGLANINMQSTSAKIKNNSLQASATYVIPFGGY